MCSLRRRFVTLSCEGIKCAVDIPVPFRSVGSEPQEWAHNIWFRGPPEPFEDVHMLMTVALILAAWSTVAIGLALLVGRFISIADARRARAAPPARRATKGERHA